MHNDLANSYKQQYPKTSIQQLKFRDRKCRLYIVARSFFVHSVSCCCSRALILVSLSHSAWLVARDDVNSFYLRYREVKSSGGAEAKNCSNLDYGASKIFIPRMTRHGRFWESRSTRMEVRGMREYISRKRHRKPLLVVRITANVFKSRWLIRFMNESYAVSNVSQN